MRMDDEKRNELLRASLYLNLDEARFLYDYLTNVLEEVDPTERGEHTHVADGSRDLQLLVERRDHDCHREAREHGARP